MVGKTRGWCQAIASAAAAAAAAKGSLLPPRMTVGGESFRLQRQATVMGVVTGHAGQGPQIGLLTHDVGKHLVV